jgi:hypothetical protein
MRKREANVYLRLQARHTSMWTGKPSGVFTVLHQLERKGSLSETEKNLFHEIDSWFDENLPNPPFYTGGNVIRAITWFKEAGTAHLLDRLVPLIQIAEKYGVTIDTVRSNAPGEIIYEDEYQVGVV